jgi:hypothetical protein
MQPAITRQRACPTFALAAPRSIRPVTKIITNCVRCAKSPSHCRANELVWPEEITAKRSSIKRRRPSHLDFDDSQAARDLLRQREVGDVLDTCARPYTGRAGCRTRHPFHALASMCLAGPKRIIKTPPNRREAAVWPKEARRVRSRSGCSPAIRRRTVRFPNRASRTSRRLPGGSKCQSVLSRRSKGTSGRPLRRSTIVDARSTCCACGIRESRLGYWNKPGSPPRYSRPSPYSTRKRQAWGCCREPIHPYCAARRSNRAFQHGSVIKSFR